MQKRLRGILALTLLHTALWMAVSSLMFFLAIAGLDTHADPTTMELAVERTWKILTFPVFSLLIMHCFRGQWFDSFFLLVLSSGLLLFLNSSLWGTVIWMTWEWIQKRRKTEPRP